MHRDEMNGSTGHARGWAARLLALALAVATAVVAWTSLAPSPAQAATCRTYTVIGVRGTGDGTRTSMGTQLPKAVAEFTALKGSSNVSTDYVSYPATWSNPSYTSSMASGRSALIAKLNWWHSACRSTKFVLFGYSQGAHVVGDVVVGLSSGWRATIYGVGLIGDPMFNPSNTRSVTADRSHGGMFGRRSAWPSGLFVSDICNIRDQVCASYSTAQSASYLTGAFGTPKEHAGYTSTTYSPIAGHPAAWWVGYIVGHR